MAYATTQDFVNFVPGFVVEDSDALETILAQAENDIDAAVGLGPEGSSIRKFDPDNLNTGQSSALARATAAQAEYRMHMGEQFFIEGRQKEVRGRDGQIQGPLPYLAPKARIELTRGRLFNLWGGRATNGFTLIPNQNVDDIIP